MPYSAMLSRLMPINNDGSVVGQENANGPVTSYPSNADVIAWVAAASGGTDGGISANGGVSVLRTTIFFPESRTVLGFIAGFGSDVWGTLARALQGSTDTANGSDGTWEAASLPGGYPPNIGNTPTTWRTNVAACTFSNAKKTIQFDYDYNSGASANKLRALHIYGVKASGQTPDDIIFLDG